MGSLIYLPITRPNLSFLVGFVSRYMQAPCRPHLDVANGILKYVYSTIDMGLFFKNGVRFELHGFFDADLGGDLDDRKSTSSYVLSCGSTSASWCSKKQDSIFLSTMEVEYKVASLATQECVWLRRLIEDVSSSIYKPTIIYGDKESALKLAKSGLSCKNQAY